MKGLTVTNIAMQCRNVLHCIITICFEKKESQSYVENPQRAIYRHTMSHRQWQRQVD